MRVVNDFIADFSKEYYDAKRRIAEIERAIASKETEIFELEDQKRKLWSGGYKYTTIGGTPGDNYVKDHEVKAGYRDSSRVDDINNKITRFRKDISELEKEILNSKKIKESRDFVRSSGSYEQILRRRKYQFGFQRFVGKISGKNKKFLKLQEELRSLEKERDKKYRFDSEGYDRKEQAILEQMSNLYPDKRKKR